MSHGRIVGPETFLCNPSLPPFIACGVRMNVWVFLALQPLPPSSVPGTTSYTKRYSAHTPQPATWRVWRLARMSSGRHHVPIHPAKARPPQIILTPPLLTFRVHSLSVRMRVRVRCITLSHERGSNKRETEVEQFCLNELRAKKGKGKQKQEDQHGASLGEAK